MTAMLPYALLVTNTKNKFKVTVGKYYPAYAAKKIYLFQTKMDFRVVLLGTSVASLIMMVTDDPKWLMMIFATFSFSQIVYGFRAYFKYYQEID
jgi:hypothetical protein